MNRLLLLSKLTFVAAPVAQAW